MNFAARIQAHLVGNHHGIRGYIYHVHCYRDGHEVEAFAAASREQARAIAADWLVRRELDAAADVIEMEAA